VSTHQHHQHDHQHDHHEPSGRLGRAWRALAHAVRPHSHDAADSVDDELEGSSAGIRCLKVSLAVLGVTALAQLGIVLVTDSAALLADTVHNFSDALTAVPLRAAFVLSRRAATPRYTYGYGRAEDLAGVVIVAVIALSALLAGWTSVDKLLSGSELTHPWVVAVAGVVGFVGNEAVATYRIRVGRRIGSVALVADGHHARTDGFTSLAVVVGAVGVLLGQPLADPVVGLVITVAILLVLRGAARDVLRRLMDGVDPEVTARAERALADTAGVVAVDRLRLRWVGHRMTAEASVRVDDGLDLRSAHAIAHHAEDALLAATPKLAEATIHVSPRSAHAPAPA